MVVRGTRFRFLPTGRLISWNGHAARASELCQREHRMATSTPNSALRRWSVAGLAVMAAGCASSRQAASLSAPSTAPALSTSAASPTTGTAPGAIITPGENGSIWSPPAAPSSAVGCQSGVVPIANVWYAPVSYLCVHAGSRVEVTLFNYPSGWSPLVVEPAGSAKVTPLRTNPDGSQAAVVTPLHTTGTFTITTYSLDNLAVSQSWILHVTVRP